MINKILETQKELDRINQKFLDEKEKLTPSETDAFCSFKMIIDRGINSLPNICDDFKFKSIYLIYHQDLTFKSEYFKPNFGSSTKDSSSFYKELKINDEEAKNESELDNKKFQSLKKRAKELGFERKVEKEEIEADCDYLNTVASEWQKTIDIQNHSVQKLKQTSEETRAIIREIKTNAKKNSITDNIRNNDIKLALWKSKYIHYQGSIISEQIESLNNLPYELELNGRTVYFTYRSLIHILYRHFAQLVSNSFFQKTKSYHSPIFEPNRIHLILENIFARLSHSEYFKKRELEHNAAYNFQFKEIDYQFYLKEFGNDKDKLMISSVYPIENSKEKEKLNEFTLKTIDKELKVYQKL